MHAILLAASIAALAEPTPPRQPPGTARNHVEVLRVRTAGVDAALFATELALRVPGAQIVAHDAASAAVDSMVFVDLQPGDSPRVFTLTLVTSDGRAYDRTIDADPTSSPADVVRLLAGNVANLVSAIEAGTATADRQDVAIPPPVVPPPPCPVCPPPMATPRPEPPPLPVPARPPPLEIGVGLTPAAVLGLGEPADADRFVGAGGGAAVWLRHRTGIVVGAELRALGRRSPLGVAVARLRVGPALGYAWRTGGFELAATAALTIEPWWVRAGGHASDVGDPTGASRRRRPLLGGAVAVIPAHRFERAGVGVRIGPRLELAASSAVGDRGRVAALLVDERGTLRTVGRLGGLELALGLDVTVWIPVGNATR